MAGISVFRSDDARAAYVQLYDAALAASTIPVTESDIESSTWIATHYTIAFPARVDRLALMCPVGIVSGLSARWLVRALTTMSVRPTERRVHRSLTPWSCRRTAGCFASSLGGQ
jgi:hypothetical protein